MRIIRTDTITHKRKIVSFNEVYRTFFDGKNNRVLRIWLNSRLLNNEIFTDREYEFKKSI